MTIRPPVLIQLSELHCHFSFHLLLTCEVLGLQSIHCMLSDCTLILIIYVFRSPAELKHSTPRP